MLFAIAISLLYVEIKESVLKRLFSEIAKTFWSEWELRLMVIMSLTLQFLLVSFGRKRKKYTGQGVPFIAISAWLIYLSSDWMATLVLSTLLRGSSKLENGMIVFWTPFLLWHLGSPSNITAYSMGDNELWLRHFLGMVFQIGEAIYIYAKFRSNTALNAMALPIFIGGVFKYVERIWALRCASPKQLINFFYSNSTSKNPNENKDKKNEMIRTGLFDLSKMIGFIEDPSITSDVKFLREVHSAFDVLKPLFVDFPFQISGEFHDEMVYLKPRTKTAGEAFNFVGSGLEFVYDLLYTKNPIQHRNHLVSLILRVICFFCVVSVLIAFSALYCKIEHSTVDIIVTYLLLLGAVCLEIYSFYRHTKSKWTMLHANTKGKVQKLYHRLVRTRLSSIKSKEGLRKMAQHDLIDYCVKAKARTFTYVIKFIDPSNLWQKFGHTKWTLVDIELKEFIYRHLLEKRSKYGNEDFKPECLDKLLGMKGDNVIQENGLPVRYLQMESTDFTRRIFVWHIATSLAYYDDLSKHRRNKCDTILGIGKSLSDYMMYLVLVRPSMLPNGFSEMVNKEIYDQTQKFSPQTNTKTNMKVSTKEFIQALLLLHSDSGITGSPQTGALWDGLKFAKQLQSLATDRWDDEKKWTMISDVWMEMMIYSAGRCTWEEHAQHLRHGGELLTHVSLLMDHLGLSTQVHRLEKDHEDDQSGGLAFPHPP